MTCCVILIIIGAAGQFWERSRGYEKKEALNSKSQSVSRSQKCERTVPGIPLRPPPPAPEGVVTPRALVLCPHNPAAVIELP